MYACTYVFVYMYHIILYTFAIFWGMNTRCQEVVPRLFSGFLVPHLHALGHASVYAEPSDPAKGTQELVRARVHVFVYVYVYCMCVCLCANVWMFACSCIYLCLCTLCRYCYQGLWVVSYFVDVIAMPCVCMQAIFYRTKLWEFGLLCTRI